MLDTEDLEKRVDEALARETPESLNQFINDKRRVKMLIDDLATNKKEINSQWVIARPMKATGLLGLKIRIRDAWAVLRGRKDAVSFYNQ